MTIPHNKLRHRPFGKKANLPFYRPISPGGVKKIDQAARQVLRDKGIKVNRKRFRDRLSSAGAAVDQAGQTVRFTDDLVDRLTGQAPKQFTLYSRDGQNDLAVGRDRSYFGNGGRVFRILDLETDGYRPTLLRDIVHSAILVNNLQHIDYYIVACQATELPPRHYHLNDFFYTFNYTTKHVMGGCDNLAGAQELWELVCLIAGGAGEFRVKPFVTVITNPISPLFFDANLMEILRFCTTQGIPVTCATAPIAGATAPGTLAGTLVQMHAEALAGVMIAQVFAPGAKVLYGAFPTTMDLRTMNLTMGSVEMGMMNAAAVELAKLYRLPIYASGGVTEAKSPDIQAGFEKNFSNLTVGMSRADCIHLTAGMLDSCNSIAYQQYVIDNENIGMIKRILAGIKVDENTLALDAIKRVAPDGQYTTDPHTLEHMKTEFYYPLLSVRDNFDSWEAQGRPTVLSRACERARQILQENRDEGLLDPGMIGAIERKAGVALAPIR